jgi:hypothetical protein
MVASCFYSKNDGRALNPISTSSRPPCSLLLFSQSSHLRPRHRVTVQTKEN